MTKPDFNMPLKPDTKLMHAGRDPQAFHGFVNPPVVHASTVLYPDMETMAGRKQTYSYGRRGTPTTNSLETAIAEVEGAAGAKLANSGLNAIALALLSCVKSGDHILLADTVYGPTRHFSDTVLPGLGVSVEYYDPALADDIKSLFRPETSAIFVESPGSLTFEMQDLPAVASAAREIDATVLVDNTWASPLYCQPLALGADLSIQACTKYIVGHSDAMLGSIAANEQAWEKLDALHGAMGCHVAPDDVYLGLRGLRTLSVRLDRHMKNTLEVLDWLKDQPQVGGIRYPALQTDPGYDIWKRDFTGSSGLCAFDFTVGTTRQQAHAFLDSLALFGLGFSWGGFESLAIPVSLKGMRTVTHPDAERQSVRLHIGLEDPEDLIKDLGQAFKSAFQA